MSAACVALVGSPNSGKTTLYNWLTGSKFKTVNYPGATVEYSLGRLAAHLRGETDGDLGVMDTPGVYSLFPKSADEEVTLQVLREHQEVTAVLVVVDGTQLERHLQIAMQVRDLGLPFAVVVTMADLLRNQGIELDLKALETELGVPVRAFDGLLGGGLLELVEPLKKMPAVRAKVRELEPTRLKKQIADAHALANKALAKTDHPQVRLARLALRTRQWDRWLLHPWLGLVIFVLVMGALFSSIYWVAAPFMDWIDGGFSWAADFVHGHGPEGLMTDFVADGLIASFGAILVFVPQIFILFLGIGFLEASGYLARAATLIDKPFSKVGLTGRSYVPILSGFSCAVPALMAARNISSKRDRLITQFVIPLMSCSARLPVYAILLAFVFPGENALKVGLALTGLYFGALVIGAIAAAILNRLIPKDQASLLLMELPLYRRPRWGVVARQAFTKTGSYVTRAGPIIFVIAVAMWFGAQFPHREGATKNGQLEQSYVGQLGHLIEPVVSPMGVDWRVGVGLISAFAAREVFVSTMAVTFNITDEDDEARDQSLLQQMQEATRDDGKKVFTVASVAGLLVFFMIALQCMSTFAMAQRESGKWSFAWAQLIVFNVVAYVLAVGIYQGLALAGFG